MHIVFSGITAVTVCIKVYYKFSEIIIIKKKKKTVVRRDHLKIYADTYQYWFWRGFIMFVDYYFAQAILYHMALTNGMFRISTCTLVASLVPRTHSSCLICMFYGREY